MERVHEEAFSEVDEILKLMPIDISSKIPQNFRQVISENKAVRIYGKGSPAIRRIRSSIFPGKT